MIDTDRVRIATVRDSTRKFVQSNIGDGGLRLTRTSIPWKFSDFKNRFVAYNPGLENACTSSVKEEKQVHRVQPWLGEEWELV